MATREEKMSQTETAPRYLREFPDYPADSNADTGMQARVFACKSGFRVQLFDLDSQEALPYLKTYADREKAYRCASHWAGADLD